MKKPVILYVDDEEINLRIFKNTFRREFSIITSGRASEGLKILKTEKIDLIITDQRMPDMTGVEFLQKVQKIFPTTPPNRLIISGYSDKEAIDEAFNYYNLFGFVTKPWEADELRNKINEALKA